MIRYCPEYKSIEAKESFANEHHKYHDENLMNFNIIFVSRKMKIYCEKFRLFHFRNKHHGLWSFVGMNWTTIEANVCMYVYSMYYAVPVFWIVGQEIICMRSHRSVSNQVCALCVSICANDGYYQFFTWKLFHFADILLIFMPLKALILRQQCKCWPCIWVLAFITIAPPI